MYSVVLMMALSGGTEAVDFGHRCHGGTGGCIGSCHGGHVSHGCMGVSHGCMGASYGCVGGGHGCFGGGHGCHGGLFSRHGCHGGHRCHGGYACTGGYVCSGSTGCCGGVIVVPPGMGAQPLPPPKVTPKEISAPATIMVSLPANAKLTVDGNATSSTSAQRTFITPALQVGAVYTYTLQAEVDGQIQSQVVQVRGGQVSQAQFNFPAAVAVR